MRLVIICLSSLLTITRLEAHNLTWCTEVIFPFFFIVILEKEEEEEEEELEEENKKVIAKYYDTNFNDMCTISKLTFINKNQRKLFWGGSFFVFFF